MNTGNPNLNIEKMKDETKYLYYRVDFKDCGLTYDFVICKSLNQVHSCLKYVDTELDDDTKVATVTITGVGMTKDEYKQYAISCNKED